MTLASETMSSILQSPQSSSAVSSKSKLGFSIDSIVGAKNNVFRSDSQSPPSPRDIEHASQKLRESLTSIVSPTDLSLRNSFFDQRDSRNPLLHHHPFGLLSGSPRSPPTGSPSSNNASLSFHRMAAAAMAAAQAAAAGGQAPGVSPPPTRGRSRSRSRSPDFESRKRRCSSSSPSHPRPSSSSPNPPSSSSQLGASPQPSSQPPSLIRPIPTNGGLPGTSNGGLPLAQSYLDHLANLKAFYDQSAAAAISAAVSSSGNSPTTCSISQGPPPGPHPALGHLGPLGGPLGHLGLHRPPGMGHPGLPPMFLGGGGPGGTPLPPQIPREYPLYPWFISRRFPGGEFRSFILFKFD